MSIGTLIVPVNSASAALCKFVRHSVEEVVQRFAHSNMRAVLKQGVFRLLYHPVELTRVLGFEGRCLQLDHHITTQLQMVKKQIDKKFVTTDVDSVLPADESESCAEFE